jgi:hypothetical protein
MDYSENMMEKTEFENLLNFNYSEWDKNTEEDIKITVILENKTEKYLEVPDFIYSSTNYYMGIKVENFLSPTRLNYRIQVITTEGEEITQENRELNFSGDLEGYLTNQENNVFEKESILIKIKNIKPSNKEYKFQINIYDEEKSLIMKQISSEFRVLKKSGIKKQNKCLKRKREENVNKTNKKTKIEEYFQTLEEVIELQKNLPKHEKKQSFELLIKNLVNENINTNVVDQSQYNQLDDYSFESLFSNFDCFDLLPTVQI